MFDFDREDDMRTLDFITAVMLALPGVIVLSIAPRSITQAAPNATCPGRQHAT